MGLTMGKHKSTKPIESFNWYTFYEHATAKGYDEHPEEIQTPLWSVSLFAKFLSTSTLQSVGLVAFCSGN